MGPIEAGMLERAIARKARLFSLPAPRPPWHRPQITELRALSAPKIEPIPRPITAELIMHTVEQLTGVTRAEIRAPDHRPDHVVKARFLCAYLLRKILLRSYPSIGRVMRKNHSTVLYSHRRAIQLIATDPHFAALVEQARVILDHGSHSKFPISTKFCLSVCVECRCQHLVLLGKGDVPLTTIALGDDDARALANGLLSAVNGSTIGECLNARPA